MLLPCSYRVFPKTTNLIFISVFWGYWDNEKWLSHPLIATFLTFPFGPCVVVNRGGSSRNLQQPPSFEKTITSSFFNMSTGYLRVAGFLPTSDVLLNSRGNPLSLLNPCLRDIQQKLSSWFPLVNILHTEDWECFRYCLHHCSWFHFL